MNSAVGSDLVEGQFPGSLFIPFLLGIGKGQVGAAAKEETNHEASEPSTSSHPLG